VGKLKEKKYEEEKNIFFASLKSMKKGVRSGVGSGSGSISQRYGSGSAPKCHGSPTLIFSLAVQLHHSNMEDQKYVPTA
jgi:hypothetical protein